MRRLRGNDAGRYAAGLASALRIGKLRSGRGGEAGGKWRSKAGSIGLATEPAAAAALAIFVISAATLAGAWYFQLVVGLPPCPLCLEERIPYHIVIPLSLLIAIAALVRAPPKLLMVGFAASSSRWPYAMWRSGAYHAGVEWHWWAGPTDCTGPLTDLRAGGSLLNSLQSIHIVRCDEAAWRFLGISLAGYNALDFAACWRRSRPTACWRESRREPPSRAREPVTGLYGRPAFN